MNEHPIEGLMKTAMNSIQDMVDVNTIIGEPIETANDIMIIPISKVCFGFAAGGSEFNSETLNEYRKKDKEEAMQYKLPFGGGSGAAVSINPVAFLVINNENIRLMPINHSSTIDKLIDYIPDAIEKFCKKDNTKDDIKNESITNNSINQTSSEKSSIEKIMSEPKKERTIKSTIKSEIRKEPTNISSSEDYLEDE